MDLRGHSHLDHCIPREPYTKAKNGHTKKSAVQAHFIYRIYKKWGTWGNRASKVLFRQEKKWALQVYAHCCNYSQQQTMYCGLESYLVYILNALYTNTYMYTYIYSQPVQSLQCYLYACFQGWPHGIGWPVGTLFPGKVIPPVLSSPHFLEFLPFDSC